MGMRTVIVTGAGGAPAFNFIESLRLTGQPLRIIGLDCNRYHLALAPADERHLVPVASDPDYLPVLRMLIEKTRPDFFFAQPDPEVAVISEAREQLDVWLCLPSKETVKVCQDKSATHLRWQAAGIAQPVTRHVTHADDIEALFERFDRVWLRPQRGAAGRGALLARSFREAVTWIDFDEGWGSYTAAEYLSPDSVTWQSLWNHGRLIAAQGRRRLYRENNDRTLSGVTGITGGAVTVNDPLVDETSLRAIRAIDPQPHGIFSVDLTYDRNGVPNPTEINIGRFFTTQLFFSQAGFNMPAMLLDMALDGASFEDREPIINPLPEGLIWLRGMDRSPLLTSPAAIEQYTIELQDRLRALTSEAATP
jgi:carbamoyl-phosphate synthase large subunit